MVHNLEVRFALDMASVSILFGNTLRSVDMLQDGMHGLRRALALANRFEPSARAGIMRAMNFLRAAIRATA